MGAKFLNIDELDRLLQYCHKYSFGTEKNALTAFLIASYTGLTLSQIIKLKFKDKEGEFLIIESKEGGSFTRKRIPTKLSELIGAGNLEEPLLFPVSTKTINNAILIVRTELGIFKYITFWHSKPTYINSIKSKKSKKSIS